MKRLLLPLILLCLTLCLIGCAEVILTDDPTSFSSSESSAESQATSETEPPAEETSALSFLACGDNIVYYGNVLEAAELSVPGGRAYNFAPTYDRVADLISGADVAMINQETLMAGAGFDLSYYPRFNGPQDMGLDLVDLGFDVISMANNHMLDKNGAGLAATIDFWKGQDVLMIGGYTDEADYNTPRILKQNGISIAFLAYTYGTNGIVLEDGYELAVPYLDQDTVRRQIAAARDAADFVIVSVHWGEEGAFSPNAEQQSYARIMTEAGADVIIGHHPHVLQKIEWLTAADGSRTMCVYSLGNFIGEQAYDYNMVGGMISFKLVKSGAVTSVENPVLLPTVYYFNARFRENRVYLLEDFTEELAASHGIGNYDNETTLSRLRSYVTDTIPSEFLPESMR